MAMNSSNIHLTLKSNHLLYILPPSPGAQENHHQHELVMFVFHLRQLGPHQKTSKSNAATT
jgi:hypothetical protein